MIDETKNLINDVDVYGSGGLSNVEDTTSKTDYGKHTKTIVDLNISDSTQATARGNYWINRYKDPVKVIDVWIGDYHELQRGMTCTLNIPSEDLNNATMLVLEQEVSSDGKGLRFRMCEYGATTYARFRFQAKHEVGGYGRKADAANAYQL